MIRIGNERPRKKITTWSQKVRESRQRAGCIMPLVFIALVLTCYAGELYFVERQTLLRAVQMAAAILGSVLIYKVFACVVGLFICVLPAIVCEWLKRRKAGHATRLGERL